MLDQVQAFLPQLAQANEKLRKEMAVAPADRFNIENTEGTSGNIVQMVIALLALRDGISVLAMKWGKIMGNSILKQNVIFKWSNISHRLC